MINIGKIRSAPINKPKLAVRLTNYLEKDGKQLTFDPVGKVNSDQILSQVFKEMMMNFLGNFSEAEYAQMN